MAIYDYECGEHGELEVYRSMSDEATQRCPHCRRVLKRVYSATPAVYKVDGFYSIDSGKRYESQLTSKGKEIYQKAKAKAGV